MYGEPGCVEVDVPPPVPQGIVLELNTLGYMVRKLLGTRIQPKTWLLPIDPGVLVPVPPD